MSSHHHRSFSTSSSTSSSTANGAASAQPDIVPLSISIPRQRSMSSSFGLATSPITFGSHSMVLPATNTLATTPPTNLTGISTSIPANLNRRFSTSFANPLTNHPLSPSTTQMDEKGRKSSFFVSSPPLSRHPTNNNSTSDNVNNNNNSNNFNSQPSTFDQPATPTSAANNHGSGGGIGGLFRKFSTGGRTGVGVTGESGGGGGMHPFESNDAGPLSNTAEGNSRHSGTHAPAAHHPHMSAVESLKASQQERPNSPMGNMMLNGQMLD